MDEDDRSVPESPVLPKDKEIEASKEKEVKSQSPIRSATAPTSPLPVSASPVTNSKFVSSHSDHNGKIKNSPIKVCHFELASFFILSSCRFNLL